MLGEPPFEDVHALTGSLKLYFRELPEPLIPYDFFSGFVTAISKFKTLAVFCYPSQSNFRQRAVRTKAI